MTVLFDDVSIGSTDPIESTPYTPPVGVVSSAFVIASTQAGTCSVQVDCGGALGWQEYASQAVAGSGCTVVVVDVPGIRQRLVFTPDAGSGTLRAFGVASGV